MPPLLSIIIPTLNEAGNLPNTLTSISESESGEPFEIIVVDAGSEDTTTDLARQRGVRVIATDRRNRAYQLNRGAEVAAGELLLFLHADSLLPADGLNQLTKAMTDGTVAGGAFTRFFDSPSRWLQFTCRLASWRGRHFGIFLGDQAIFVRASTFDTLGGFNEELAQCEDLDFSLRLAKRSESTRLLRGPVISHGRRFQRRGAMRQTFLDAWTTARFIGSHRRRND